MILIEDIVSELKQSVIFNRQDMTGDWYMQITYNEFTTSKRRVCTNIDLFADNNYKLPYSVLVSSPVLSEPRYLESFSSGIFKIFLLSHEELKNFKNE